MDAFTDVHSSATGMAASDPNPRSNRLPPEGVECLTSVALRARLEEEIARAERHSTQLSCLLVMIENLDQMTREHGTELREQTLEYIAAALQREMRRFDRVGRGGRLSSGDLVVVLPGADSPRAEIVARRALERLRTIKVEAQGTRWPLHVSVGLATWHQDTGAQGLLEQARAAMRSSGGETPGQTPEGSPLPPEPPSPPLAPVRGHPPQEPGGAGRS